MGESTVTYTISQDGTETAAATWEDTALWLGAVLGTNVWYGLVLDASSFLSTDSERGLLLDPPIIKSITITHTSLIGPISDYTLVYFVPDSTPADYATGATLGAGYRNEWIIGYSTNTGGPVGNTVITLDGSDGTVPNPVVVSGITTNTTTDNPRLNIAGAVINSADTLDTAINWGRFQSYVRHSTWDGKIALTVHHRCDAASAASHTSTEGAPVLGLTAPAVSAVHVSFHTGQMGLELKRRARVRHDPKSGFPGLSDEFIRDDYTGLMVLPESWDPEDRTNMDFFPPSSEGVVDDEVL